MSLTSLILHKPIRRLFRETFVKPRTRSDYPLLVPRVSLNPSRIGTAFDYVLRFYLGRLTESSHTRAWTAEEGLKRLKVGSRVFERGRLCLERTKVAVGLYERTGRVTKVLLRGAIDLATLDLAVRVGPHIIKEADFFRPFDEEITELRALIDLARRRRIFRANQTCVLSPTFGEASALCLGADADLILDRGLFEIKTTAKMTVDHYHFDQLIGYYTLMTLAGVDSPYGSISSDQIDKLCIYYSRYGRIVEYRIDDIIDPQTFPSFVKQFCEMACSYSPIRREYYQSFSWHHCRAWAEEISPTAVIRESPPSGSGASLTSDALIADMPVGLRRTR